MANFVYTLCHQWCTYRQKRHMFYSEWVYVTESVNWCQDKTEFTDCNMEIKLSTFIKIKRSAKWACVTFEEMSYFTAYLGSYQQEWSWQ